ncbi:hypothetical protein GGF32_009459 [Allomyces javanicus]|nr:hypothetical protein GGF32_009459 [Allomyces javanicus]
MASAAAPPTPPVASLRDPSLRETLLSKKSHGVFVDPADLRGHNGKLLAGKGDRFQLELLGQFVESHKSVAKFLDITAVQALPGKAFMDMKVKLPYNRHMSLAIHATEVAGLSAIDDMDVKLYADGVIGTEKDPSLEFTYKVRVQGDEQTRAMAAADMADMTVLKMLGIEDFDKLDMELARKVVGPWHDKIMQYIKMLKTGVKIAVMLQETKDQLYRDGTCKQFYPPAKRVELSLSTFTTASLLCSHYAPVQSNRAVVLAEAISKQGYSARLPTFLVLAAIMTAPEFVAHTLAVNERILETARGMEGQALVDHLLKSVLVSPKDAVAKVDLDATEKAIDALLHSTTGDSFATSCRKSGGTYCIEKSSGGGAMGAKIGESASSIGQRFSKQSKDTDSVIGGQVGYSIALAATDGASKDLGTAMRAVLVAVEELICQGFEGLLELGCGSGDRLPGTALSGTVRLEVGWVLDRAQPSMYGQAWSCPKCGHDLTRGNLVYPAHISMLYVNGPSLTARVPRCTNCDRSSVFLVSDILAQAARIIYYHKNPDAVPGSKILPDKEWTGSGFMSPDTVTFVESFHAKWLAHVDRNDPIISRALDDMFVFSRNELAVELAWALLTTRPGTAEYMAIEAQFLKLVVPVDWTQVMHVRAMVKNTMSLWHGKPEPDVLTCSCPVCERVLIPARPMRVTRWGAVLISASVVGRRHSRTVSRHGRIPLGYTMCTATVILSRDDDKYGLHRPSPDMVVVARQFLGSVPGTHAHSQAEEKLVRYHEKGMVGPIGQAGLSEIHGPVEKKVLLMDAKSVAVRTGAAERMRKYRNQKKVQDGRVEKEPLSMTPAAIKSRERRAKLQEREESARKDGKE